MQPARRLWLIALSIYVLAQIFFLINIQFPTKVDFDEFHYVPSAKQFLHLQENQNWEHPPLGKELMAVGIGIFGDRPIGWRFMSTFFGALTLVGMFFFGRALFRDERSAWTVTLLALFNQLLYVQARIGMLDTFMMGFLTWGMAAFFALWREDIPISQTKVMAFIGVMLGLATACKWFGVIPWVLMIGLVVVIKIFQHWGVQFKDPGDDDWYKPGLFRDLTLTRLLLLWVLLPLFCYFLTFIPFLFVHRTPSYGILDLFDMQYKMWSGQLRVVNSHPYMSKWTQWPLLGRPIWYAFDQQGGGMVRGVLLLGNPLEMWLGVFAILFAFWMWIERRSREAFLIVTFYAAFLFCWIAIPRTIAFYYYYYPAGMILALAITYLLNEADRAAPFKLRWIMLASCAIIFIYFFPILAALKIDGNEFRRWMWFSSWI